VSCLTQDENAGEVSSSGTHVVKLADHNLADHDATAFHAGDHAEVVVSGEWLVISAALANRGYPAGRYRRRLGGWSVGDSPTPLVVMTYQYVSVSSSTNTEYDCCFALPSSCTATVSWSSVQFVCAAWYMSTE
jgi:hypothetical protein